MKKNVSISFLIAMIGSLLLMTSCEKWSRSEFDPNDPDYIGGAVDNSGTTDDNSGTTDDGSKKVFKVGNVSFTMIKVEGGSFMMGNDEGSYDEKPAHQVTLSDFYIAETEVTEQLYAAVMGTASTSSTYPKNNKSYSEWGAFTKELSRITGADFRLPTEAEWEYAARGGKKSQGCTYSGSFSIDKVAWYYGNSKYSYNPVKTKDANELGIYDMSGNVREFCSDYYSADYYSSSPENNPTGPESGSSHVVRGGSYYSDSPYCTVYYRVSCSSSNSKYEGARVVLTLAN